MSVRNRRFRAWRIAWTVATLVTVQVFACGVAAVPSVFIWLTLSATLAPDSILRLLVFSAALVPLYALFAFCLTVVSPFTLRAVGWRTPPNASMRIADLEWDLLQWVRYGASLYVVRILAGTLFRGTPIWTWHLRLNGARLGRRVYVNTLQVSDYNLLEFGDDVVIGDAVHLSGQTVEAGVVKTAAVRLERNVTIGLCSVIEIGVEIGAGAHVGALSFVPKFARLEGGIVYVGAPAAPVDQAGVAGSQP